MHTFATLSGILGIIIGVASFYPYIREIFSGKTHPHAFTWFAWMASGGIIFAAQITSGGGLGTWVTASAAGMCLVVFILALRYGETDITPVDYIALGAIVISLVLWALIQNPLWSVVLLSAVGVFGWIPTFRKTYHKPHTEHLLPYTANLAKFGLAIFALSTLSWTTLLYPAGSILINGAFVVMVLLRRKAKLQS